MDGLADYGAGRNRGVAGLNINLRGYRVGWGFSNKGFTIDVLRSAQIRSRVSSA